jgi:exonuclease III
MGKRNAKTYLKIEGITGERADVILISDIRASDKGEELKKLFGLTMNGSYKIYLNSSKESRGVGIAIKRNLQHVINNAYEGSGGENVLMIDVTIKGTRMTLGVVYGPNNNDVGFYRDIERKITEWGNINIIGGDFNTILSDQLGAENLDREGLGRVPNRQNSKIINDWVLDGLLLDPFRTLYSQTREYSCVPFRGQYDANTGMSRFSKTRLDFFLVSPELIDNVDVVKYEDRLGSDFDHREVTLKLGRRSRSKKVTIYDSTINDMAADDMVMVAIYEGLVDNLTKIDQLTRNNIVQLNILTREKEQLVR